MTARLDQAWCPGCQEWTVLDPGQPCAWCSTMLVRKRGGWKRPDHVGRISETAARAIHAKYQTGVSARTLGRELFEVLGYKSARSCEVAIGTAFSRHNLPVRGRLEASVLASTRDGLSPRDWRERYRRRKAAGYTIHLEPLRPLCKGVRQRAPGKGQPCSKPAAHGSAYCVSHDPERDRARRENLEHARARIRRPQPKVEIAHAQVEVKV